MALRELNRAIVALSKSGADKKEKQKATAFSKSLQAAVTKALNDTTQDSINAVQSLMGKHAPDIYAKIGLPMFKVAAELINEVWKNRLYPCLDKAEGSEKVRKEKEMWEKLLDEGVIAGLQTFIEEHGDKIGKPFAETLYPPLSNIIIDDKAPHAAVPLRKQAAGLLCDTAKPLDCKLVILKDTVLGPARLGEAIADAYSYALLDPLFELLSRMMAASTNPLSRGRIGKNCIKCDKIRTIMGEQGCDRLLKIMLESNLDSWEVAIKQLVETMAEHDIKRPQPFQISHLNVWMVNFDTDQPMYADQDSFQIDIKDGSEISLMEIKYSTITEMRLLQGSSAETHRIRCTTKEPPKFPGKNFQLGIAETLKTVSFDIPKESSMHWKKLMESRHETRNASVALEPISFPVEDSKTQHATSEEATTPARGKLNTVATAMIAEAAAASKPSARLDEAAEKRTPSRYIGSKSSSQKSSGDQPAARTRLAHKALPDDGSSELSEDEDPPVRLPAKQRSKKTASSISTARQPRQVENSVVSELSSPPTHNGSSHIATNSESPSPRATRKAAIVARSLIQQQQPPTTQKAPTDQTPSHDLEDTPEIIEVSAIPEAVTPPAAEAPSEPTQSSGRFSRARRHPDDGQEESPSSQDDSPPRGANKRETAAKTMRSTKPAAQAAPRKAARGAKREREDSDTANDVEADAALDHPPSKKAKVKGRGYGGRDRKDKKPTSRTTHVSSTNDATNTGGNTAEETISLSIAQPQQAVTPATPVLRRAISSESTGAPSKASSAGTSRKALRINEASETPTSRGADLNTAVDFPDLAPRVPLNDLTEDRRTIRDSDVSGQKSKGSSSGTSSGQRKRASGKPKEKAPWESRVFDAAEHLAKRERTSEVNSMTSSPMKSVEAKRAPVAENESDEEITAISPPKVQSKARFSGDPISSSPHISILTDPLLDETVNKESNKRPPKLKSAMKTRTAKSQETESRIEQTFAQSYNVAITKDLEEDSEELNTAKTKPKRGASATVISAPSKTTSITSLGVEEHVGRSNKTSARIAQGKASESTGETGSGQAEKSSPPKADHTLVPVARNAVRKKLDRVRQKQTEHQVKSPKRGSRTRDVFNDDASATSEEEEEPEESSPIGGIRGILDQFCDIITGNVAEKVAVVRSDAHIACAQIVAHSKADLTVLHTQKRAQMDAVLCVKMQYLNYIKEVSNAHAALHDKNVALMTALKNTITTHDNNSLAGRLPAKLFS